MAWRASIARKRPDLPGSGGKGSDICSSNEESEDDRQGNVDSG